jgi:hypothetical protein
VKQGNCGHKMGSLLGTFAVLAIGYIFARNLPDIVRYIRISRM